MWRRVSGLAVSGEAEHNGTLSTRQQIAFVVNRIYSAEDITAAIVMEIHHGIHTNLYNQSLEVIQARYMLVGVGWRPHNKARYVPTPCGSLGAGQVTWREI